MIVFSTLPYIVHVHVLLKNTNIHNFSKIEILSLKKRRFSIGGFLLTGIYSDTAFRLEKIDQFMKTGAGLYDIFIHPQIDCPEYRNLFNVVRRRKHLPVVELRPAA